MSETTSVFPVVLYKLLGVMEHQWVPSTRSIKLGESLLSLLIVAIAVKLQRTVFPSGRAGCQGALLLQSSAFQRLCMLYSPKISGQRWPYYASWAGVEAEEGCPQDLWSMFTILDRHDNGEFVVAVSLFTRELNGD